MFRDERQRVWRLPGFLAHGGTSGARDEMKAAGLQNMRLDRGEHQQSPEQASVVYIDALYVSVRLHCQTKGKKDSVSQCLSLCPLSI